MRDCNHSHSHEKRTIEPGNLSRSRAVVVAKLVEWLNPIPEFRCSNLVISKNLY